MSETLKLIMTEYNDLALTASASLLMLVCAVFISYYVYNRKKFRQLTHQIPADVVKNYLDSIIQNSSALKSNLFRGGGLDVGAGAPAVMPASNLPSGDNIAVGASADELNQKNAEISQLRATLSDKESLLTELEAKLEELKNAAPAGDGDSAEEISKLKAEIEDLKKQLEEAKAAGGGGGGDEETAAKLAEVTKERDELKERLQEYEIIEDDLANLKKLQQENEQLKKSLAELKGGGGAAEASPAPEAPTEAPAAEEPATAEEATAEEATAEEATAEEAPAAKEAAPAQAAEGGDDAPDTPQEEGKSAEDLLSEFEKMLG